MLASPYHYGLQYLNLSVSLGTGVAPTIVRVEDYQNPGPNWFVKVVPDEHWQKVLGRYDQHVKQYGRVLYGRPIPDAFELKHVQLVHKGAGSPSQIRTVLQLVHLYWKELKLDNQMGPIPDLQKYVDRYIGLYCTGFVGNYTSEVLGTSKGPNNAISSFAPLGSRRQSPHQIQKHDAVVWKNGGHVAIINEIIGQLGVDNGAMWLVESSSDGSYRGLTLGQENRYRIKKQLGDLFIVTRGLPHYSAALGSVAGISGGVEVYFASAFI